MRLFNRLKAGRYPILVAISLLYWAFGFYPYQLPPYYNGAIRTADNGLRFDTPGIACSREPPNWLPTAITSSSLQVTLEVRAARIQKRRWARILSLSRDSHHLNLSIAQDGNGLIVRVRSPETNLSAKPGHVINEVFAQPGWHRIELNVLPHLLTVMADGREVLRERLPIEPLSNWSPEYRLAFGNSLGFSRPWLGELRKAIVHVAGRQYDYMLPDALEAPASYQPPFTNHHVQWIPFSNIGNDSSVIVDKIVNLFGFIPFGMILAITLRQPRSVWALAAMCCAMSLSIEVGQLFLAPRTPSIDDLLLNTLGGALGAWLGLRVRARSGHG